MLKWQQQKIKHTNKMNKTKQCILYPTNICLLPKDEVNKDKATHLQAYSHIHKHTHAHITVDNRIVLVWVAFTMTMVCSAVLCYVKCFSFLYGLLCKRN